MVSVNRTPNGYDRRLLSTRKNCVEILAMRTIWSVIGMVLAISTLAALIFPDNALELVLGMLAPLTTCIVSLLLINRTYRNNPAGLNRFMVQAFAVKFACFGLYVPVTIGALALNPSAFISSFVICFVTLHFLQANYLRQLFGSISSN